MAENRKKTPEKKETDGNFNYIVRIANTDIDGEKKPAIALTTVKGIGLRSAEIIVRQTGVSRYRRFGEVPQEKVEEIENIVNVPLLDNILCFFSCGSSIGINGYKRKKSRPLSFILNFKFC